VLINFTNLGVVGLLWHNHAVIQRVSPPTGKGSVLSGGLPPRIGSLSPGLIAMTNRLRFFGLGLFLATTVGCAGRGDVSGQVKFNGELLPKRPITFFCEGGDKPVLQAEISQGNYHVHGLPQGHAKITVGNLRLVFRTYAGVF